MGGGGGWEGVPEKKKKKKKKKKHITFNIETDEPEKTTDTTFKKHGKELCVPNLTLVLLNKLRYHAHF